MTTHLRWGRVSRRGHYASPGKTSTSKDACHGELAGSRQSAQNDAGTCRQDWHKTDTAKSANVHDLDMENPGAAGTAAGVKIGCEKSPSRFQSYRAGVSAASKTHAGLPAGLEPFALPEIVCRLREHLGLTQEDVAYLNHAIHATRREDYQPGRLCGIWASPGRLALELGVHPRRLHRTEERLEGAGLIRRTIMGNGRRAGARAPDGRIVYLMGIDLSPLIGIADQLVGMVRASTSRAQDLLDLRRHAQGLAQRIRATGDEVVMEAARVELPRMRPSEVADAARLLAIIGAWEALVAEVENRSGQTVSAAPSDTSVRPYTKKDMNIETCSAAENGRMRKRPAVGEPTIRPEQVAELAAPDMREAIELYAEGRGTPGTAPDWQAVVLAARDMAATVGISKTSWSQASASIGEEMTAICFVVAHRNASAAPSAKWQVRDIPGAFVGLLRKVRGGGGQLERLIGALSSANKSLISLRSCTP